MSKGRAIFVFILFFALYAAVGARLYVIQVNERGFLASLLGPVMGEVGKSPEAEAADERLRRRGQIFMTDRSGNDVSVAMTREYPLIFVSPKEIGDPVSAAASLAPVVLMDPRELAGKIAAKAESGSEYLPLLPRASDEQVKAVQALKLKGVSIENSPGRFYAFDHLASQVIGFVGMKDDAQTALYGAEQFHDERLAKGESVRLTIDRGVQDHAEGLLEELIEKYGATGGTIIVQEPTSGAILAMTSKPDFDPNRYGSFPIGSFLNPAVQLIYEPGSVIKPFTLSAGLDTGKLSPETTYTDTGSVTLNGKTVRNFQNKVYGTITMREVIQNSVNTGAIFAERAVGHDDFYRYLSSFGLGEETGIGLPGEIRGNLRNLVRKEVRAIDFATAAYGQGISVTPVGLISAYSALGNGGVLMKPFIEKDMRPEVVRRVLKKETAETVTDILVSSVVKNKVAAIPNYKVAGKTGTAFIIDPATGKYSEEMIHTFVGYAPASNPRFTVLVKMERPAHGEAAGETVVTTFKKLTEFLLQYYHVPPDNQGVQ